MDRKAIMSAEVGNQLEQKEPKLYQGENNLQLLFSILSKYGKILMKKKI